jgi:hypothetical protein
MNNETKQTAVQWYASRVHNIERAKDFGAISPIKYYEEITKAIEQAKEMEKERLIYAQMDMFHFLNNLKSGMMYLEKREEAEKFAKQYYNETYGGNK